MKQTILMIICICFLFNSGCYTVEKIKYIPNDCSEDQELRFKLGTCNGYYLSNNAERYNQCIKDVCKVVPAGKVSFCFNNYPDDDMFFKIKLED